jgi:hypothetical protein
VITYPKSFGDSSSGKNGGDPLSAVAYFTFLNIHAFLAVTNRVNTNVLVVEKRVQRYAIRAGVEEFKSEMATVATWPMVVMGPFAASATCCRNLEKCELISFKTAQWQRKRDSIRVCAILSSILLNASP